MSRFPFGIPLGWFPVAWGFELAPGELLSRRYFGQELVIFRGTTGKAHVLDAYCPHLGANLGVGGQVVDDTIRCPFHGWRFAGDGACLEIPYAKRMPPNAKTQAFPTRESGGLLWAWYHPEAAAPSFEPPEIPEYQAEGWTREWTHYEWTIATHPQEVAENSVDWPHFAEVHLMEAPPTRSVRFEGHEILWEATTSKSVTTLDGMTDEIRVVGRNPGLGSSYVRYSGMLDTVIVMGMTPVDQETMHMRFGVIGNKAGRSDDEMEAFHKPYADDMAVAVQQDFPIWENKIYRDAPRLCDGDGPVSDFRRWASQFYVGSGGDSRSA